MNIDNNRKQYLKFTRPNIGNPGRRSGTRRSRREPSSTSRSPQINSYPRNGSINLISGFISEYIIRRPIFQTTFYLGQTNEDVMGRELAKKAMEILERDGVG